MTKLGAFAIGVAVGGVTLALVKSKKSALKLSARECS